MNYVIRLAISSDVDYLPAIERAAARLFLPYLERLCLPLELLEGLTTTQFLRRAQADQRLWVASVIKEPIGFVVVKFLLNSCFVIELDVHPSYGRQGIGSALMRACCHGASSRGAKWMILTTFRYVPWNIPFYRQLGFKEWPSEQWPVEIEAIVQHEARYGFLPEKRVVMRRQLRAA